MGTIAIPGIAVGAPALLLVGNAQASRVGARPQALRGVESALRSAGARVDAHLTETVEELAALVSAADGRRLAVLGGDGSLHALANLGSPPAEVAILPAGGANNIAAGVGIPRSLPAAVQLAVEGHARSLDGIDAVGPAGRYTALEGVSAGFLARARVRYRSTSSADLWEGVRAGIAELRRFRPVDVVVAVDGEPRSLHVTQLFVANTPRYAFGLEVAPAASPFDGELDVVAVGPRSRPGVLAELGRLRRGAVPPFARAERVTLRSDDSPVVADSTSLGSGLVSLTVRRDVLRVVAP